MEQLIIYDKAGTVLSVTSGTVKPAEPVGVPFMWATIPEGKTLKSVDVSKTPHELILEDVPPREFEVLRQENTLLKAQNQALTERADFIEDVVAEMAAQVYQ